MTLKYKSILLLVGLFFFLGCGGPGEPGDSENGDVVNDGDREPGDGDGEPGDGDREPGDGDGDGDPGRQPFGGEPWPIPGTINAVDFDEGGPGVAYFDQTPENEGGAYRPEVGVGIEESASSIGGYNVGWIEAGEWLEYTVEVQESDTYDLHLRVSSMHDGRHLHVAFDGEDVTGRVDVPNTGDWQRWATVTVTDVALEAGRQVMRVSMDTDLFNLHSITVAPSREVPPGDFYVSPFGSDDNPGTRDRPFRTLERARDAVREINSEMDRDLVVYLRQGRFELPSTLTFGSADSGVGDYNVVYRAYPGEQPSVSGGRQITGWTHFENGIFRAPAQGLEFRQLYVDDRRALRARTPGEGDFHRLVSWNEGAEAIGVRVLAGQISQWSNFQGVEMVINKHWHQSRFRLESFTVAGDHADVVFQAPERHVERLVDWPNREPNQVFYFENSLDFLDGPGEWYLDVGADQLYYWPREGENLSHPVVVAPHLTRLVEVDGARRLRFEGLVFEHSNWLAPSQEGFIGIQASSYRVLDTGRIIDAALRVQNSAHIAFYRNVFRNMGGVGLELARGTYRTQIEGNVFVDIASSGIDIYTWLGNRNPGEADQSRFDVVRNNYISRIAADYTGGVGIWGSYTHHLTIEHNELTELPYTAISVGWGWSSMDTAHQHSTVRRNRIHRVMQLHDDGGGIYTLSKQPGTVIEENYVFDIARSPWADNYEIAALYLDEQTEGVTLRNNVVRNLSGDNMLEVKLHQVNPALVTIYDNGAEIDGAQEIMDGAGLEGAYEELRDR